MLSGCKDQRVLKGGNALRAILSGLSWSNILSCFDDHEDDHDFTMSATICLNFYKNLSKLSTAVQVYSLKSWAVARMYIITDSPLVCPACKGISGEKKYWSSLQSSWRKKIVGV